MSMIRLAYRATVNLWRLLFQQQDHLSSRNKNLNKVIKISIETVRCMATFTDATENTVRYVWPYKENNLVRFFDSQMLKNGKIHNLSEDATANSRNIHGVFYNVNKLFIISQCYISACKLRKKSGNKKTLDITIIGGQLFKIILRGTLSFLFKPRPCM